MALTVGINSTLSLVHKGSNAIAKNTPPDVCKTPSPAGPVPVPYPVIISMSNSLKSGTTSVKGDKKWSAIKGSEFSRCNGDEPGTVGGVVSNTNMKEAKWILYSFDVKMDGKNCCRLTDKMTMNHGNTVCLNGVLQIPKATQDALGADAQAICESICKHKDGDKQKGVAKDFSQGKLRAPKSGSTIQAEVGYRIPSVKGGPFRVILSVGRFLANGARAPGSLWRILSTAARLGRGHVVIWDLVQLANPAKHATPGNVKKIIEVKFGKDKLTKNQKKAIRRMSKSDRRKLIILTPKKCGC